MCKIMKMLLKKQAFIKYNMKVVINVTWAKEKKHLGSTRLKEYFKKNIRDISY